MSRRGCCRQSTVDSRPLLGLLLCLFFLQGCSLLFVAKGGTHVVQGKEEKAPQAASQSKEMNRTVVIEYKVQEGDTFQLIAEKYYGRSSTASKIAKENHLNPKAMPKKDTILKIVNPVYFLSPEEQAKKPVSKKPKAGAPKANGTASPTPTPEPTPQKIDKVPRPKVNNAFGPGEKLKYEIRALSVLGGYGILEVGDYTTVNGRPCVPLSVRANAVLPLSSIFAVDDLQTSYFDTVDFLTWKFENKVHEGNYKAHNLEKYDQLKHKVLRQHNEEKSFEMDVPPFAQDIISCFYYYRLLPLEVGKTFDVPTQSGGQNYHLVVTVVKKEKITVPAGTFDCLRVKPLIKQGTVFRNNEDIDLWVTDDARHIPVKIQSGIVIGSIDVDLLEAGLPTIK